MKFLKIPYIEKGLSLSGKFGALLKEAFMNWLDREPFNNSATIAYYTIFSLPGLLIIIVNVAGYFFDKKEVTEQITSQIQAVMGGDTAKDVEAIMNNASESGQTFISSALGIATLLFGATGVFYKLQQMLNRIWNVEPKTKTKQRIFALIKDRLFSFGLIIIVGFLLLVSLVLSAGLSVFNTWVSIHLSNSINMILGFSDILLSIVVITILFAAIFKYLPDVEIKWKDVWLGAFLTAILFVIAKFAIGFYIGQSSLGTTYGAAGTIILIMLWVSYAGLILLYGAEFTFVYIKSRGVKIEPKATATLATDSCIKK